PAEQRAHPPDDAGHIAIPDDEYPPLGRDVHVIVVDADDAPVAVADERPRDARPAACRLERDADGGLEAGFRGARLARVADAALPGTVRANDRSPASKASRTAPQISTLTRSCASAVEAARCGVRITRSSRRSGASGGRGSTANTSIAAPPMR